MYNHLNDISIKTDFLYKTFIRINLHTPLNLIGIFYLFIFCTQINTHTNSHALKNSEYLNVCKPFRLSAVLRWLGTASSHIYKKSTTHKSIFICYWIYIYQQPEVFMLIIFKRGQTKLHCFVLSSGNKSGFINTCLQQRNINPSMSCESLKLALVPYPQLLWIFHSSPSPVNTEQASQRIRLVTWKQILGSNKQDHMWAYK